MNLKTLAYSLLVLPLLVLPGTAHAEEEAAKEAVAKPKELDIVLEQKCNKCHAVSAFGVEAKKDDSDEAEEEEDGEERKAGDLSRIEDLKDADFYNKYLAKKERIEGKKHKKRFKGTDEERKALVDWLISINTKE